MTFASAISATKPCLGERTAQIAHILGGEKPCRYASADAQEAAKVERASDQKKRKQVISSDGDDTDTAGAKSSRPAPSKKRKAIDRVEKSQSKLKLFKGIDIPFTKQEKELIADQFGRATVSGHLPFGWADDPEMIRLLLMFRSDAGSVIPSRYSISGPILEREAERIKDEVKSKVSEKPVTMSCVLPFTQPKDKLIDYADAMG